MGAIEQSIKSRIRRLEGISEMQDGFTVGLQEQDSGDYIALFPDSKKGRRFNDSDIERMTADRYKVLIRAADGGIYIYD